MRSTYETDRLIDIVLSVFLLLIACLFCLFIAKYINNCFDITDESYILLGLLHPNNIQPFALYLKPFSFLSKLLHWEQLLFYRKLRFFLTIGSSLILSYSLIKYFKAKGFQKLIIYSFVGICALFSYSYFPLILSYNVLTLINLMLIVSLVFFYLSQRKDIFIIFIGTLSAYQFYVKFTVVPLLLTLLIVFLFYQFLTNFQSKIALRQIFLFGSGFLIALIIFYPWMNPIHYVKEMQLVSGMMKDHSFSDIMDKYDKSWENVFKYGFQPFKTYIYLCFLSILVYKIYPKWISAALCLISLSLLGKEMYPVIVDNFWYRSGTPHIVNAHYPYYSLFLVSVFAFLSFSKYPLKKSVLIVFSLTSVPFIAAIGSINEIFQQIVMYYIFPALVLLVALLELNGFKKFYMLMLLVPLILLMSLQTYYGLFWFPYRQIHSLDWQNEYLSEYNHLYSIKLDSENKEFMNNVINSVHKKTNFEPGDYIIDFAKVNGLVVCLNGKTPRSAWFSPMTPERNAYFIETTDTNDLSKSIIFMSSKDTLAAVEKEALLRKNSDANNWFLVDSFKNYLYDYYPDPTYDYIKIYCDKNLLKTTHDTPVSSAE